MPKPVLLTLRCLGFGTAASLLPTWALAQAGIPDLAGFMPLAPEWAVIGHVLGGAVLAFFMMALLMLRARLRQHLTLIDELLLGVLLFAGLSFGVAGIVGDPNAWAGGGLPGLSIALPALLLGWRCHARGRPGAAPLLAAALLAGVVPVWSALSGFPALSLVQMPPWSGLAGVFATLTFLMLTLPLARPSEASRRRMPSTQPVTRSDPGVDASVGRPDVATVGLAQATRPMLVERVEQGIARARRAEVGLALLWVEVRGMPDIERLLGADVADRLLNTISERLDRHLRVESMLARTGQYSFGAVCEAVTDIDEVMGVISGLRAALMAPCALGDGDIAINASFGHAMYPADGADAAALCRAAARRAARTARADMRGRAVNQPGTLLRKVS